MYFIGFVFSGFILMLSDVYGRKKLTIIGTFLSMLCVYGLYFCTSINMAYFLLFLTGLSIFRSYAFYMLTVEITQKHLQIYICSIYLAAKGAISVFIPAFYFLFGGKDWKVPYSCLIITAPILLGLTLFIPESPRYYYENRMYPQLRALIKKFARTNGVKMDPNYDIDKELEEKENMRVDESKNIVPSKLSFLKQPIILVNLFVIVV